jgi:YHS domain-containing protein
MDSLVYFLLWAGVFFLLMRFGCGAHVMGHSHKHQGSSLDQTARSEGRTAPREDIDPVCGMKVDPAKAKSSVFGDRAYYFCSASCREKFEAAPQAFVQRSRSGRQPMEHAHGSLH